MKSRGFKVIGTILIVFIFVIGVKTYRYVNEEKSYIKTIQDNWGISIPKEYSRIYSLDSGPSFLGDGERYNVFEFNGELNKNIEVKWEEKKSFFIENSISAISKGLEVKEESKPNFQEDYKYYYNKEEDSSEIYMILLEDSGLLYVIENIM